MVFFLKVVVTAAGAALAGISMDLQSVQSTASSLKTCPAAVVGRISRYMSEHELLVSRLLVPLTCCDRMTLPHFLCPPGLHASGRRSDLCRCPQGTHKWGGDRVSVPLWHEAGSGQAGWYRHQWAEDSSGGGPTPQTKVLLWQPFQVRAVHA